MDAFDTDVLIYAAIPDHPLGRRVAALFPGGPAEVGDPPAGVGSVVLLPEVLTKPTRERDDDHGRALTRLLSWLDLRPVSKPTAELAVTLGAAYGLLAADSLHLATAVEVGADRFVTNNRRDFPKSIEEIDITYPTELADPGPA